MSDEGEKNSLSNSAAAICVRCKELAVDAKYRPFCSRRCQLLDLGAWAAESYVIPVPVGEDDLVETSDPIEEEQY